MTWKSKKKERSAQQTKLNSMVDGREERRERTMTTKEKQKTFSLLASKCGLFATHFYEFGNFLAKLATKTDHEHASGKSYHVGIRRKRLFSSSNYGSDLWNWRNDECKEEREGWVSLSIHFLRIQDCCILVYKYFWFQIVSCMIIYEIVVLNRFPIV